YVHTAGAYVDKLLSKLLFTHHRSKNEVNMTVYNQSFLRKYFKKRKPIISMIHSYNLNKIDTTDGSRGLSVYQTVAYLVMYQKRGHYDGVSRKLSTEIFERRKPLIPYDLFYMVCSVRLHCRCCTWTNSLVNCCLR